MVAYFKQRFRTNNRLHLIYYVRNITNHLYAGITLNNNLALELFLSNTNLQIISRKATQLRMNQLKTLEEVLKLTW